MTWGTCPACGRRVKVNRHGSGLSAHRDPALDEWCEGEQDPAVEPVAPRWKTVNFQTTVEVVETIDRLRGEKSRSHYLRSLIAQDARRKT